MAADEAAGETWNIIRFKGRTTNINWEWNCGQPAELFGKLCPYTYNITQCIHAA